MAGPWTVRFVRQRVIEDLGPEFERWRFDREIMHRIVERLGYIPWVAYGISGHPDDGPLFGVRCVCPVCHNFAGRIQFLPTPRDGLQPVLWWWNGSMDRPTVTPSIRTNAPPECSFHVYVTDGQIIDAGTPAH